MVYKMKTTLYKAHVSKWHFWTQPPNERSQCYCIVRLKGFTTGSIFITDSAD